MNQPLVLIQSVTKASPGPPDGKPAWLSAGELARAAACPTLERRREWLASRWLAKSLVLRLESERPTLARHPRLDEILIHTRNPRGVAHAPWVTIAGRAWSGRVSLAHADGWVAAAAATDPAPRIGIDLVPRRLPGHGWSQWLTPREQRECGEDSAALAAVWSAKEAVYKATNQGERFIPRAIEILPDTRGGWRGTARDASSVVVCRVEIRSGPGYVSALATESLRKHCNSHD